MGRRTWAALGTFVVLAALVGAGIATAPGARADGPPPSECVSVSHDASAAWVFPDGQTSAGVLVRQGPAVAVVDGQGLCMTAPVWINATVHTATNNCETGPLAIPASDFAIDPTLSTARLDTSTSCGDLHVTWTSPSPPSLQPVICLPNYLLSCFGTAVILERASHAAGTMGSLTVTTADEWPVDPPYLGIAVVA